MQINTSLSTDPNASAAVKHRPAANPPPSPAPFPQSMAPEFDLNRLQALDGDQGVPDESGANQALGFLQSNFLSQPGSAMAAQANLSPESAYALLV